MVIVVVKMINALAIIGFFVEGVQTTLQAMEYDRNELGDTIEQIELMKWYDQIENVKEYSKNNSERFLVLGASQTFDEAFQGGEKTPTHLEFNNRFSKEYVFLDKFANPNPNKTRELKVDFNDLRQLKKISTEFLNYFDKIILDDSTYKYTEWTKEHLICFKNMLKEGGEFIFGPSYKITFHKGEHSLQNILQSSGVYSNKLCKDLQISETYDRSNLADFATNVYKFYVLPQNVIRITEDAFGPGTVKIEYDTPLLFNSRYSKTQKILLTATKYHFK